jgi:uncharacterized ferritin-like protein (DUF455 family)
MTSFDVALREAWFESAPPAKLGKVKALSLLIPPWEGTAGTWLGFSSPPPIEAVGRPERPKRVEVHALPRRRAQTREGHAALLHAIAHIEFNAINLALDCLLRFGGLPPGFYAGWLNVAQEEAAHFGLVSERLAELGYTYGDFPAHDGLWQMAAKTTEDPLERMALVPRVLEARGLDATPPIMARLAKMGDLKSVAVLEIILRDEIGHVALGDEWFRFLCAQRGLEPEAEYVRLLAHFKAPFPRPPLNEKARLQAGFSEAELLRLCQQPPCSAEKGRKLRGEAESGA